MLEDLDDSNAGLIAGYTFLPEQRGQRLNWTDAQNSVAPEDEQFRWLHLNLAMRPARRWLEEASAVQVFFCKFAQKTT